jgi:hypothetical protein
MDAMHAWFMAQRVSSITATSMQRRLAIAFSATLICGCGEVSHEPGAPARTQPSEASSQWYAGGSLHKASGQEWRAGSYRNKLATCADFVTTMYKSTHKRLPTMERMKEMAEQLVVGLDALYVTPDDTVDQTDVAEAAPMIWVMTPSMKAP